MHRLPVRLASILALVTGVLVASAAVGAEPPVDPERTIDAADGATDIVQGEIVDETWRVTPRGLVTDWTVDVSMVVAGDAGRTIVVRTEGGTDPQGFVHKVSGQPELAVGDRVQLWLRAGDAGRFRPVGGTQAAAPVSAQGRLLPQRRDSADNFAYGHGMFNPWEDYATTWEAYFMSRYHGPTELIPVAAKIANVDRFFASL